jgi:hypothetical protein
VVVKVTPETQERWDSAAADDPSANNRSQFIRKCVNQKIEGTVSRNEIDDLTERLDIDIDAEQIENLSSLVERLSGEVDSIKDELYEILEQVDDSEKIDNLAREIHSLLPEEEPTMMPLDINEHHDEIDLETVQRISDAEAWAFWMDEDESTIRKALARMTQYFPDVVVTKHEIEEFNATVKARRYYRA